MNSDLKETFELLNERNQTLVVSEYEEGTLREEFKTNEFLPKEPLLGYCVFNYDDIAKYIVRNTSSKEFKETTALARLGFLYYDSTISVGIRKEEDRYLITTYDSYNDSFFSTSIPLDYDMEAIIEYIALDIRCKSNVVESVKENMKTRALK